MATIYRHPTHPSIDVPDLDLLSFLFESSHSLAQHDTLLHISADNPARSLTTTQLRDLTQQIAYTLRHTFGIGSHGPNKDVVTVIGHGQPIAPAAYFGTIAAGGVYSAASPSSTPEELSRQLELGHSRILICSVDVKVTAVAAANICGIPASHIIILESEPEWSLTRLADTTKNLLTPDKLMWQTITDGKELTQSLITIIWSSGTTGVPKGVMLSHRNLVAEAYIIHLQGREHAARQVERETFIPQEYRHLAHLPHSHISGLFGYFISAFYGGQTIFWMRKYEWKSFLAYAKKYKITILFTVPSIWLRISKSPDVRDQFSTLHAANTGSAAMGADLQTAASAKTGMAKDALISPSWGLSETTGGVTMSPAHVNDERGSLGPILPGMELRLVDDLFKDVPDGVPGELLVRGPTVMNGYFNNPTATAAAFHDDWFCTGDIAICKEGKFYIVDRKKELIKYKGLQIAPVELENVLITHRNVLEAAVVGVPSLEDESSEVPRAYVVVDAGNDVIEEDIKAFVADRVARYKQLRGGVVFVKQIPKNSSGKILRRVLREQAKTETQEPTYWQQPGPTRARL